MKFGSWTYDGFQVTYEFILIYILIQWLPLKVLLIFNNAGLLYLDLVIYTDGSANVCKIPTQVQIYFPKHLKFRNQIKDAVLILCGSSSISTRNVKIWLDEGHNIDRLSSISRRFRRTVPCSLRRKMRTIQLRIKHRPLIDSQQLVVAQKRRCWSSGNRKSWKVITYRCYPFKYELYLDWDFPWPTAVSIPKKYTFGNYPDHQSNTRYYFSSASCTQSSTCHDLVILQVTS